MKKMMSVLIFSGVLITSQTIEAMTIDTDRPCDSVNAKYEFTYPYSNIRRCTCKDGYTPNYHRNACIALPGNPAQAPTQSSDASLGCG